MKLSSFTPPSLPLISLSLALCATPAFADGTSTETSKVSDPEPGCTKKCTPVDFHDNNGWGNGDQDAPGNSGDHNNAENGPGTAPGNGNGNSQKATTQDDAVQKELLRLETEALALKAKAEQESAAAAAAASKAQVAAAAVVARRVK